MNGRFVSGWNYNSGSIDGFWGAGRNPSTRRDFSNLSILPPSFSNAFPLSRLILPLFSPKPGNEPSTFTSSYIPNPYLCFILGQGFTKFPRLGMNLLPQPPTALLTFLCNLQDSSSHIPPFCGPTINPRAAFIPAVPTLSCH